MFRKPKSRLRALFHRDDIGDEIEAHIEQLTDEFVSQGVRWTESARWTPSAMAIRILRRGPARYQRQTT